MSAPPAAFRQGMQWLFSAEHSPYSGQESRAIKSLSEQEIESLRRGDGMGFAKLAELNHFPGPRHVLDISDGLGLSAEQLLKTEALYEEMRLSAVAIGEEIIAAESRLNQQFTAGAIGPESLETALLEIGRLRADLRYVHLHAHLRQKQLLTLEQVHTYDALRGYDGDVNEHGGHQDMKH